MILTIQKADDVLTGVLSGRLDTPSAIEFEKEMAPLLENADKKIILDFAALEYISSSGLRRLLTLRKAVESKGGRLEIRHLSSELRKIFTITGFIALFDIKD